MFPILQLILEILQNNEGPPEFTPSTVFTASGQGNSTNGMIATEGSTKTCTQYKKVTVEGSIGGGAQRNNITVYAYCDGQLLVSLGTDDPGNGASRTLSAKGNQISGNASCRAVYTPAGQPDSSWTASCKFE